MLTLRAQRNVFLSSDASEPVLDLLADENQNGLVFHLVYCEARYRVVHFLGHNFFDEWTESFLQRGPESVSVYFRFNVNLVSVLIAGPHP